MADTHVYDAVVVGSGPNGLAAAIELARNGRSVCVLEANDQIGGGMRSGELTIPGFIHDLGSAIHPMGFGSPFFKTLPLEEHGLERIDPLVPLAHPFDDGTAAVMECSVEKTGDTLGPDARAYRRLMGPLVRSYEKISPLFLGPPRPTRHLIPAGRFGMYAIRSAHGLAESMFEGEKAKGLFAGNASHAFLPMEQPPSASFGLVLSLLGHVVGWPFPKGGAQKMADALASYLISLGGEVRTGVRVESVDQVPETRAVLFDVTPRQLLEIAGKHFPKRYRRALGGYRYGPGVFKMDFALDGPVPWKAEECLRAGTVHLGGTLDEISAGEAAVARGDHPERPFVLLAQQSLFDKTRAPEGKHAVWAYCHVPNGSTFDMSERIESQIERFAPGFRDRILAKSTFAPADLERQNANLVGGDINGGYMDLRQLFTRPVPRPDPYSTPTKGLYICSSSTPPGGATHGMCGYFAARSALRYLM